MRIVIAPDSFKECLRSAQVATAITKGVKSVVPDAVITSVPLADGGEGTVEALVEATGGRIVQTPSVDALGRPIQSYYGVLGDELTAVIEMAAASGLELIEPENRNPLRTSTFGTGLLLKAALEDGFNRIILSIGGSATNDGGAGMAQALGFGLLDKQGKSILSGGGFLDELEYIDRSAVLPLLREATVIVACDVQNPLLGPTGASQVYGPQKGASLEMVEILEANMAHFSRVLQQAFGQDFSSIPGSGAAGGLGAGLLAFCGAELVSGFELISQLTGLPELIKQADLVFTGEGKIDRQTAYGKTISGVARIAKMNHVPVVALAGIIEGDLTELYACGITSVVKIAEESVSVEESKARAAELLESVSARVMQERGMAYGKDDAHCKSRLSCIHLPPNTF